MSWASVLAFAPLHNSHGKRDVSAVFHPEANRFLEAADTGEGQRVLHRFDNRKPMAYRAAQVIEALNSYRAQRRAVVCVAFFCHGYATGLQAGFRSSGKRKNVDDLAEAIAEVSGSGVIVPLYACSTAGTRDLGAPGGDGGFADELRDALCRHGARNNRVDAHSTKGHATVNPYARRFEGGGSYEGGKGGEYIVEPGSENWQAWRRMLGTPKHKGAARFHFPWWDRRLIEKRVAGK